MKILFIIAGLEVIHYLYDYVFVSVDMLNAKRIGKPYLPIIEHAYNHAFFMTLFSLIAIYPTKAGSKIVLSMLAIEIISHSVIDILKGRMNIWFPEVSHPQNKSHWIIFGLDQLLHHIVILILAYIITVYT